MADRRTIIVSQGEGAVITLVRIEASRYNAGGEAMLYFHGEYSRFDELETGGKIDE